MGDRVIVSLEGTRELKRALLAMDAVSTERVLRPIVGEGAETLRATAATLAPVLKRPHKGVVAGALRKGIEAEFAKAGIGYCHFVVKLKPEVWYGWFLEFGLGSGGSGGESARVKRRRANYGQSMKIRRELLERWAGGEDINVGKAYLNRDLGITYGLSRRELRRQWILEKGWNLQGQRRPNMQAQPFMRPAVRFARASIITRMLERIAAVILRAGGGG